jgi:hypothetical protein
MLHKDYDYKSAVAKNTEISAREPQAARRQDELIGGDSDSDSRELL